MRVSVRSLACKVSYNILISHQADNTTPNSPGTNGTSTKLSEDKPYCKHCKSSIEPGNYDSHVIACQRSKKEEAKKRKKEKKEAKAMEAAAKAREQQANGATKDKDGIPALIGSQETGDGDKASVNGDTAPNPLSTQAGTGAKKPPKKSATKTTPVDKKTKKRKADAEGAEKEPKKKKAKKDEDKGPAPKAPKFQKPKGPVNVETQCGVPLDPEKGGFCARSLTCKSHSMGLKRAVPGRSLPYDQLLANYQKKNQAKQQKALMEAQSGAHPADEDDADGAAVDSDEEKEAVMKGLSRWRPRPLEQVVTVGIGRRYRYVRMKEALGSALAGTVGGGQRLFGVPTAAGSIGQVESSLDGVDSIADGPQRSMSIATEGGRKGSVVSAGGGGIAHGHPNIPKGVAVPVRKGSVASSAGGA